MTETVFWGPTSNEACGRSILGVILVNSRSILGQFWSILVLNSVNHVLNSVKQVLNSVKQVLIPASWRLLVPNSAKQCQTVPNSVKHACIPHP